MSLGSPSLKLQSTLGKHLSGAAKQKLHQGKELTAINSKLQNIYDFLLTYTMAAMADTGDYVMPKNSDEDTSNPVSSVIEESHNVTVSIYVSMKSLAAVKVY